MSEQDDEIDLSDANVQVWIGPKGDMERFSCTGMEMMEAKAFCDETPPSPDAFRAALERVRSEAADDED